MNVGGENKAGENSCVRFSIYGKLDPNLEHIFGPNSGTLVPIQIIFTLYNLTVMAGFHPKFQLNRMIRSLDTAIST